MPRTVTPTFTTDADGAEIALVPLAGSRGTAKLLRADYDRLIQAGWPDHWTYDGNGNGQAYVRVANSRASGHLLTVARIIAGAGSGRIVTYRDLDRLNLRADNLEVRRGRSKRNDIRRAQGERDANGAVTQEGYGW